MGVSRDDQNLLRWESWGVIRTLPDQPGGATIMKKFTITTATVGILAATAVGLAGAAAAAPLGGSNAADTVNTLKAQGFSVQLNGTANVPLSRCTATGVNGLPDAHKAGQIETQSTTVYVDISCPDNV